jgi:hypothetical protein
LWVGLGWVGLGWVGLGLYRGIWGLAKIIRRVVVRNLVVGCWIWGLKYLHTFCAVLAFFSMKIIVAIRYECTWLLCVCPLAPLGTSGIFYDGHQNRRFAALTAGPAWLGYSATGPLVPGPAFGYRSLRDS